MSQSFSEDDVVERVARLTRAELFGFIDGELVRPQRTVGGYVFASVDIARLELLCDLSQDLDLDETAMGIVISLIDQLHAARQDLAILARLVDAMPAELQAEFLASLRQQ